MQISKDEKEYNLERLWHDPLYNIEAGANHLLNKWEWVTRPNDPDRQYGPNILEHWYFTPWAHNRIPGKEQSQCPSGKTYQERIIATARRIIPRLPQ